MKSLDDTSLSRIGRATTPRSTAIRMPYIIAGKSAIEELQERVHDESVSLEERKTILALLLAMGLGGSVHFPGMEP